jgi:hypothetical protein
MSKIVYDKLKVVLRDKDSKDGPVSAEEMKEILGWEVEGDKDFGTDYKLRNLAGEKVRLNKCPTNRPFRLALAKRYMNEMIRKKWRVNGETIVVDRMDFVQSGQHRGVGLILAEESRQKNVEKFREHFGWRTAVNAEFLLVCGISEKAETVDTLDLGQKRSLGDVFYRRQEFEDVKDKDQKRLANILAGATRLAWLRAGGMTVSDAKHFPHSEALDFRESHPRLLEAVQFVYTANGGTGEDGNKIATFISLGFAAGLMYLMGTAQTDALKWEESGRSEEKLNYKLWSKAEEFWQTLASGADLKDTDPILVATKMLAKMSARGADDRDEKCAIAINAWNLWVEGKKCKGAVELKPKKAKNDLGKMVIVEMPRIGGLDIDREPEEPEAPAEEAKTNGQPKKRRGKKEFDWTGEWAYVKSEDGAWKGKVVTVDGTKATVKAEEDNAEYIVKVADLMADPPEA